MGFYRCIYIYWIWGCPVMLLLGCASQLMLIPADT